VNAPSPQLAPPGAGLPWFEALVVRWFGRRMLRSRLDWERAQAAIARVSSRLAKEAMAMDDETLARRVLIKRLRGLEDSSRYWSPAMVLEHLVITGEMFTDFVVTLSNGRPVEDRRGIADIKPRGELGRTIVARFVAVHEAIPTRLAREAGPFRDGPTHWHPWFGKLTALDWLSLTAAHLGLHEKQWRAIRATTPAA
jgi:DinB superfamily